MADSEARPLLTSYDATVQPHSSLQPAGGRGKQRFEMRQQMKNGGRQRSVMTSIFPHPQKAHRGKKVGSPVSTKGQAKAPNNSLSIDQDVTSPGAARGGRPEGFQHSWLYTTLNPKSRTPSALLFRKIITAVILVDALIYIVSTEPSLSQYSFVFYGTEAVTSTIFAIEYIARLVVCGEKKCCAKYGPIRGRLHYMGTSRALIDAFATFPFFIELFTGLPLPTLTYLRVFRLLRISRTASYSHAMDAVGRVLYFNREILLVAGMLGMYLVVVTSVLMYYLRPRGKDAEYVDDPADFESIGSTMVLSILMLTGQGGPSGSLPWYTQCVVLLTGMFSVAMFAIPASMLTWGFEAEAERLGAKAKKRALAARRGEVYVSDTSSSSSAVSDLSGFGDISTSDEEYMNIIGGGDDDDGNDKVVLDMQPASLGRDEVKSLLGRTERLEQNVVQTNVKLDVILQKLNER